MEVRVKRARKKEDAAHGRGIPSSKVWLVWSHRMGREGVGMLSRSQVINYICIGHRQGLDCLWGEDEFNFGTLAGRDVHLNMEYCYRLNYVPHKRHVEVLAPWYLRINLLGNRVIADITSVQLKSYDSSVGP